jgi:hypothetical protein
MKGSLCRLAETSFLWRDTAMRIRERFNPRAPCGARLPPRQAPSSMPYFNPCAPCGARRRRFGVARAAAGFQPTRPLRGATPHVLQVSGVGCISTHAPLAGRDRIARTLFPSVSVFQPTRPLRGATVLPLLHDRAVRISTHAPLAGRDSKSVQITMHIFAITDKFQMLLHRMPPVRAFCSFLMQENHADFGCEPPK